MIDKSVKQALDSFYENNNLPLDGGKSDPWVRYSVGRVSFTVFPNFSYREEAITRHDLHHVLNDIDTSNLGEGLIASWELGAGCKYYWFNWFMESQALWFGILRNIKGTWNHFVTGRNSKSLFEGQALDPVLEMSLSDFRSEYLPLEKELNYKISDYFLFISYALMGAFFSLLFLPVALFFSFLGLVLKL